VKCVILPLFYDYYYYDMSKPSITLIKLGGAIITDKEKPMTLRPEVLSRLVKEVAQARIANPDDLLIVGHGAGSFAHYPATQYKTIEGFINKESVFGMAKVQDVAAQLNRIVVGQFLAVETPAVSVAPSSSILASNHQAKTFCGEICEEYLNKKLLPVTYGDVLVDEVKGCTVWSTEEVLSFLAQHLVKRGWQIKQIIHVTEVEGFYDTKHSVVSHISSQIWPDLQHALTATKGFDVTGGMGLKIEESLKLAQLGIQSRIISGLVPDRLYKALTNEEILGTVIYD